MAVLAWARSVPRGSKTIARTLWVPTESEKAVVRHDDSASRTPGFIMPAGSKVRTMASAWPCPAALFGGQVRCVVGPNAVVVADRRPVREDRSDAAALSVAQRPMVSSGSAASRKR